MQALSIEEVVVARGFKWRNLAELEAANQPLLQTQEQEKVQRQEAIRLAMACSDCV